MHATADCGVMMMREGMTDEVWVGEDAVLVKINEPIIIIISAWWRVRARENVRYYWELLLEETVIIVEECKLTY